MVTDTVVRSTCELCSLGCGVLIYMKDDRPIRVEGDPENPINKGVLCVKGMASLEYLYHPERLKYPMKRMGERGKGKWQRITWDEALDTIAAKLIAVKEKYGAQAKMPTWSGWRTFSACPTRPRWLPTVTCPEGRLP
jgi:anaerobic selenocysteine-containing dehydrogenase